MKFFEKVNDVCQKIPYGKVASYGQIAAIVGQPRAARQVGWAMHSCPEGTPAHRVVNREGRLSGAGAFTLEGEQAARLRAEGIEVTGDKVDLKRFGWQPAPEELYEISKSWDL